MCQRALKDFEKALGPEHMSTVGTINNPSFFMQIKTIWKDAEAMYQRALKGYEKAWRPEHTSTLRTIENLGNLDES